MIGWTNPAALWALVLVAGPVIVHLLRRHRAERVVFPSLRFVRPTETAAVRLRMPSDLWLLLLRAAAIALAVCALAGPIVLTRGRVSQWTSLTARAVVIDTSESMREAGADGPTPQRIAEEAAEAELRTAAYATRIESPTLGDGLRRASAWLASAPPARREIVVLSDFQRGAIDAEAIRIVPEGIGRRLTAVGRMPASRSIEGAELLGDSAPASSQRIDLTRDSTAVSIESSSMPALEGLRFVGIDRGDPSIARLLRAIATAGAAVPSKDQPIALRFTNAADEPTDPQSVGGGWMLATLLGVMNDPVVRSLSGSATGALDASATRAPWMAVLRRPDGAVIVSAAAVNGELRFSVAGRSDSLFATAVTRAALNARSRAGGYGERDIATTTDRIAEWQAAPGPVDAGAWRNAAVTDARWCWLAALGALGLEQRLRRRLRRRSVEEDIRAAA